MPWVLWRCALTLQTSYVWGRGGARFCEGQKKRCGDTLTCKQKPLSTVSKSRQTVQSFPGQVTGLSTSKWNSPELCRPGCHSRNSNWDLPTVIDAKCHHIAPSHASFVLSQILATFALDDWVLHCNTWHRRTRGVNSCGDDRPCCQDCLMKILASLQSVPPQELWHQRESTTSGTSCWNFCRRLSCNRYMVKVNPMALHIRDRHGFFRREIIYAKSCIYSACHK